MRIEAFQKPAQSEEKKLDSMQLKTSPKSTQNEEKDLELAQIKTSFFHHSKADQETPVLPANDADKDLQSPISFSPG